MLSNQYCTLFSPRRPGRELSRNQTCSSNPNLPPMCICNMNLEIMSWELTISDWMSSSWVLCQHWDWQSTMANAMYAYRSQKRLAKRQPSLDLTPFKWKLGYWTNLLSNVSKWQLYWQFGTELAILATIHSKNTSYKLVLDFVCSDLTEKYYYIVQRGGPPSTQLK